MYPRDAVEKGTYALDYIPDCFVTSKMLGCLVIDKGLDSDEDLDEFVEWYNDCNQRKNQKVQVKEKLLPVAWHPSRWWNWCVPEDEKKETEELFNDK